MKWIVLAFILIPTAELAILIYSGQTIGLLPTYAIILITGIGGAYLAKRQGTESMAGIKKTNVDYGNPRRCANR